MQTSFLLIGLHFVLQIVLRVLGSGTAELDESEQLILTQGFRWGYASQPPLYTWLQMGVFAATGKTILGIALLKWTLLFCTFMFVGLAAKEITGMDRAAIAAALSLFFVPQIAWESQRDLTHSVLATTASAATLLVFIRLIKTGKPTWFILLGLCAGIGVLSKYNYILFFGALLLAGLALPQFRQVLFNRWLIAMVVICLGILLPHLLWAASHVDAVLSHSTKLHVTKATSLLASYGKGFGTLLESAGLFIGPMLLIYATILFKAPRMEPTEIEDRPDSFKQLLRIVLMIELCCCLIAILVFKAQFKDRWMQPLLFFVPILLVMWAGSALGGKRLKTICCLASIVALAIMVAAPLIPRLAARTSRPTRLNAPYPALAAQLHAMQPQPSMIVAESRWLGGNLKLHLPNALVVCPEFHSFTAPGSGRYCVVWDAAKQPQPPAELVQIVSELQSTDVLAQKPLYIEAPMNFVPTARMKLGIVWLPLSEQRHP